MQMSRSLLDSQRQLLPARLERLAKLVRLNAPQAVLDFAGEHTIRAIVYGIGPSVLEALGKKLIGSLRSDVGLCPFHDGEDRPISSELTPHGESWGMCDDCLASAREGEE